MSQDVCNILISGTRTGIGHFLAQHFLDLGHKVFGCSRGQATIEHDNYRHYSLDITDEQAVLNMYTDIRSNFSSLQALINNAGIASMNHSLLMPMDSARRVLDTNLLGTFLLARQAAKLMRSESFGRIVNFTTVAVPLKLEGEAIYAASKAAVITLTEILAKELAPFGITVNAVGPTPIATDLIRSVPANKISAIVERQAIKRIGTFADVANVVEFFLRPSSEFVTGQTIFLGGL